MKKIKTLLATVALALPMAVTPLAPAATLIANASTTKAAKGTTYTLVKAPTLKKTSYHVTKSGLTLEKAVFGADKSTATLTPTKTKLAAKATYTTTKAIELSTGKKGAKPTTYYLLKTSKGTTLGWVKGTSLAAGAYATPKAKAAAKSTKKVAKKTTTPAKTKKTAAKKAPAKTKKAATKKTAKKVTTKKVTKKTTPKKATVKKASAKATTLQLTKKATATKKGLTAAKAATYYKAAFAADRPTVTLTKAGSLKAGKTYHATKAFYAKTSAKAAAHEYVFLTGAGWTATAGLKAAK